MLSKREPELEELENYQSIQIAKDTKIGKTSLVVQWLRIGLAMLGTPVQSLVRELRSHMPRGN